MYQRPSIQENINDLLSLISEWGTLALVRSAKGLGDDDEIGAKLMQRLYKKQGAAFTVVPHYDEAYVTRKLEEINALHFECTGALADAITGFRGLGTQLKHHPRKGEGHVPVDCAVLVDIYRAAYEKILHFNIRSAQILCAMEEIRGSISFIHECPPIPCVPPLFERQQPPLTTCSDEGPQFRVPLAKPAAPVDRLGEEGPPAKPAAPGDRLGEEGPPAKPAAPGDRLGEEGPPPKPAAPVDRLGEEMPPPKPAAPVDRLGEEVRFPPHDTVLDRLPPRMLEAINQLRLELRAATETAKEAGAEATERQREQAAELQRLQKRVREAEQNNEQKLRALGGKLKVVERQAVVARAAVGGRRGRTSRGRAGA